MNSPDIRIGSEDFLDFYEPIDISQDDFWIKIKELSPDFYNFCEQVQYDILEGRNDYRENII